MLSGIFITQVTIIRRYFTSDLFIHQSIKELEDMLLSGQKLQGPATADEVYAMLVSRGCTDKFPLFTAVHRICIGEIKPELLIDQIRSHPEHVLVFNYFRPIIFPVGVVIASWNKLFC